MEKEEEQRLGRAIFNLQRFQIIQAKLNPETANKIPNYYAYAWYDKVYPLFDDSELHEDLKEYFTVSAKEVEVITKYADDEWNAGKRHTFYEYETHFNVRGTSNTEGMTRVKLLKIFRYCFLKELFDKEFWTKLIESQKHPIEASTIINKFSKDSLFLF